MPTRPSPRSHSTTTKLCHYFYSANSTKLNAIYFKVLLHKQRVYDLNSFSTRLANACTLIKVTEDIGIEAQHRATMNDLFKKEPSTYLHDLPVVLEMMAQYIQGWAVSNSTSSRCISLTYSKSLFICRSISLHSINTLHGVSSFVVTL